MISFRISKAKAALLMLAILYSTVLVFLSESHLLSALFGAQHCPIWFHLPCKQGHFFWNDWTVRKLIYIRAAAFRCSLQMYASDSLFHWAFLLLCLIFLPLATFRVLLFWPQWSTVQGGSSGSQHHHSRAVCRPQAMGAPGSEEYLSHWQWGEMI